VIGDLLVDELRRVHVVSVVKGVLTAPVKSLAGVACRRRQKKYESPQSTSVAAAQPHELT